VQRQRRSYRELVARAGSIPKARVEEALAELGVSVPVVGLARRARADALRITRALGERGLVRGREADLTSMITEFITGESLRAR